MKLTPATAAQIRIGSFTLDPQAGELRKGAFTVRLQEQPFDILAILVSRPGEVVTREELRHKLWPADTFVDFEHGLNRAINKLRQALGDEAGKPQYIETLPRRGYRLIAPVEQVTPASPPAKRESPAQPSPVVTRPSPQAEVLAGVRTPPSEPPQPRRVARRYKLAIATILAATLVGGSLLRISKRRSATPADVRQRRLTANPVESPVSGAAISPDGRHMAYSDPTGIYVKLVETGETHKLAPSAPGRPGGGHMEKAASAPIWTVAGWFPDGTTLLMNLQDAAGWSIWTLSTLGGAPRKLREDAWANSVSPDGSLIAFTTGEAGALPFSELCAMGPEGENARRIASAEPNSHFTQAVWAPSGRRMAARSSGARCAIETHDLTGGPATVVSDPELCRGNEGLWWLPDGRLIYSQPEPPPGQNDDNLWQIRMDTRSGLPAGKPRRITNAVDSHFWDLTATRDGKRLAFLKGNPQSDVYVGELEAKGQHLKTPRRLTLDQEQDLPSAWTPDSQAVLFDSDRTGSFNIFKQALDQNSAEPLTMGSESKSTPRLSPEGSWILYSALRPGRKARPAAPQRLMRMPAGGGPSQLVLEARGVDDYHCARAPAALCVVGELSVDGKQLLLSSFDPVKGRGNEVGKIRFRLGPGAVSWDLSPDASRIAFTEFDTREGRIHFLSLNGETIPDLVIRGRHGFMPKVLTAPEAALAWAPDGKGIFVTSLSAMATTILYVDLQGHAYPLWEQQGCFASWSVPSPDGRYLAIARTDLDSNVWTLENF